MGVGANFSLKVQDKQRLGSVKISTLFGIFQVNVCDQCLGSVRPEEEDKFITKLQSKTE